MRSVKNMNDITTDLHHDYNVIFQKNIINTFVPTKIKNSRLSAPWFNNNLKRLTRKKRRLYHRVKRFPSERNRVLYARSVRLIKKQIECSKTNYEKNLFSEKSTFGGDIAAPNSTFTDK